jgi:hypothetical protein
MAQPITWQTINAPSFGEANRLMGLAQQSILGSFDGAKTALADSQAFDKELWKRQDQEATQQVLGKIYQAKTLDEFNALRQSGALNQTVAANGARIDLAAVNALGDTRPGELQKRAVADIQFRDTMLDDAQAGEVRRINTLALSNPKAAADELAKNPNLRKSFEIAKNIDTQANTLEERQRARDRFGFDQNEEKRKDAAEAQRALLRPIELESAQLGNQGKRMQNSLTGLQINEAKLSAADKAEARRLDNTLAAAQQNYLTSRDATGRDMGVLAQQLSLPMTSVGHPDFSNMTQDQLDLYDKAAAALPNKLPLSKDFMTGDTKVANQFYQSLVDSKQYTPATLKKFKDSIRGAFDTNAIGGRVGNDAYNRDLAAAQNQVAFDAMNANNWYAPGSPNALKDYDNLAREVDKMFGPNEREDLPDVQKYLSELATKGVVVGKDSKGKDIVVTPSVNDVLGAVRSTYEGWNIFNSGRKKDIKKTLEAALKTPEAATRFQQGQDAEAYRRKQAVTKILGGEK